jgi:hypothetical protein
MKLERSKPEDGQECVEWMTLNREENAAAIESLKGCTFFKIAGILYLPVKVVLMLESVAPNPLVKGERRLLAFRRAIDDLRKMHPHAEIIFLTKGNTTLDAAAEFYGFDELPYKVYRMRANAKSRAEEAFAEERRPEAAVRDNSGTL